MTEEKLTINPQLASLHGEFKRFSSMKINLEEIQIPLIEMNKELNKTEILKEFIQYIGRKLTENPKLNLTFDLDNIPDGQWKSVLSQLVVKARALELKEVKIVSRKKKYDITELRTSYYGKKILEELPELRNRMILGYEDYNKVKRQCGRLKIELPEVIRPTTTELFFEEN